MMDYKIKFEYKGMGKQASGIRQSVLQSQKAAKQKQQTGGATRAGTDKKTGQNLKVDNKELVSSLKTLNSSTLKLIASNNSLSKAVSKMPSGGGGGGSSFGGGKGIGGIGASIPIAGAMIAMAGFVIQKISQVGNAYIQLAGQQKGSVGTGGFRGGQGMYLSGEMGAGMKAYASKTGKFAPAETVKPDKKALDVGAIYGLSAQEVLGQAGTFKRSGADYGNVAAQAMGGGIQTELPTLLSGMASMMEESIRNGMDASEMSKDLGKNLVSLTKQTGSKSVDAALNIVKSFKSTQDEIGKGKFGSLGGLYTAQASRKIMMDKFTGEGKEKYLQDLQDQKIISKDQREKLSGLKQGASFQDVQRAVGATTAHFLEKRAARKTGTAGLLTETMRGVQKTYGKGPEGMQKALNVFASTGGIPGGSEENFIAAWKAMESKKQVVTPETTVKGAKEITKRAKGVMASSPGMATVQKQGRETMTLKHGAGFADLTLKFEQTMINMADAGAKGVQKTMNGVSSTIKTVGTAFDSLTGSIDKVGKTFDKLVTTLENKLNSISSMFGFGKKTPAKKLRASH